MNKSVLVLDDNKNIRNDLKVFLEDRGYQVYTADSADIATEKADNEQPDYAIIDLMLEETNKYEGFKGISVFWFKNSICRATILPHVAIHCKRIQT